MEVVHLKIKSIKVSTIKLKGVRDFFYFVKELGSFEVKTLLLLLTGFYSFWEFWS